jgi:hypothetical protein
MQFGAEKFRCFTKYQVNGLAAYVKKAEEMAKIFRQR